MLTNTTGVTKKRVKEYFVQYAATGHLLSHRNTQFVSAVPHE